MASKPKHQEQEEIVAQYAASIYEAVEGLPPDQVKHGEGSKVMGLSGYRHQIDVSVWGPHDLILIECKHRERRHIGVSMVLEFLGRLYDIGGYFQQQEEPLKIHGIMVATKPFQAGAKKIAQHYEIDLQSSDSMEYFGMKYKHLLLVTPPPAMAKASASDPGVVVSALEPTIEDRIRETSD